VQFHPSYSYEDFFEGFRPYATPSGQPSFQVTPGALRRLASEAAKPENRGQPFVLIVDEMNRANIAKVFGELYFLLEYRSASVSAPVQAGRELPAPRGTCSSSGR